jgi:hypothetical protein
VFVSFATDSGIRFDAHFYDVKTDKVETRSVTGWVTGDDGLSQATVLVPDSGIQVRVGAFQNFLAVVPKGQEETHQALLDAKVAEMKRVAAESKPSAQA